MNKYFYLILWFLISCNNENNKSSATNNKKTNDANGQQICWTGTLNNKIPVLISYQIDDNIITGTIIYLNTKQQLPIKLIGTIEEDKSYRLLEFEETGNVTGVITGLPTDKTFNGSWFSPKTRKELTLNLVKKDTTINYTKIETEPENIFGLYRYQFSEEGYQGDFRINKIAAGHASFGITCVTGEPSRNIALINEDTIALNNTQFIYKLEGTDDCEFEVKFFKGFAYIRYTKGFCKGQFGMNASIDGIFLKMK